MNQELDSITGWIVSTIDAKKAEDIAILDLEKKDVFADRFVIATAQSRIHLRALADEVRKALKEHTNGQIHLEGYDSPGWILFECRGVVLHLFVREKREYYSLERLWGDAPRMDVERYLTPPAE